MKKQRIGLVLGLVILIIAIASMVMATSETSRTIAELGAELVENKTDVLLASIDANGKSIKIPVTYYQQKADACVNMYDFDRSAEFRNRQFGWSDCGYYIEDKIEEGIVRDRLNEDGKLAILGGKMMQNRGVREENFSRWFSEIEGSSRLRADTISLVYDAEETSYKYESEKFYPVPEAEGSKFFTMDLAVTFRVIANGREEFSIVADDDTWVFVGDELIIDMGGVHGITEASFRIVSEDEVAVVVEGEEKMVNLKLRSGERESLRIFHANRDSNGSVFKINLKNMITYQSHSVLADSGEAGEQVAYAPSDSYEAPLGESIKVSPDRLNSLTAAITVQMVLIGISAVLIIMATSWALRYWRHDHIQE